MVTFLQQTFICLTIFQPFSGRRFSILILPQIKGVKYGAL